MDNEYSQHAYTSIVKLEQRIKWKKSNYAAAWERWWEQTGRPLNIITNMFFFCCCKGNRTQEGAGNLLLIILHSLFLWCCWQCFRRLPPQSPDKTAEKEQQPFLKQRSVPTNRHNITLPCQQPWRTTELDIFLTHFELHTEPMFKNLAILEHQGFYF